MSFSFRRIEDGTMNRIRPTALLALLCALVIFLSIVGCGGGGGGGFFAPDTDFEGISGPLDFSSLATPTGGFSSAGWPVPADTTNFSVTNFTNTSTATLMLANFTAVNQTIVLSANQEVPTSLRGELRLNERGFGRTEASNFHASLRGLEERQARNPAAASSGSFRGSVRAASLPETYTFKVYKNSGEYIPVVGDLYHEQLLPDNSGKLRVYRDATIDLTIPGLQGYIDTVIGEWNAIYTQMHALFGTELRAGEKLTGIDLGSDIYILISPELSKINTELAGFFYSGDLYPAERLSSGITNNVKIFYLNLRYGDDNALTETILASTMAHEFQHMIFFSNRIRNSVTADDSWLNETLSAYAEHACNFKVTNGRNQSKALMMQEYFNRMYDVPLVQNGSDWGSNAQYGQVALFGEWLAEKYGTGGDVSTILSSKNTGMAAVEEFTGKPFETVYTQWMTAMYLDPANNDNPLYKFNELDWISYEFPKLSAVTLSGPIQKNVNRVTSASMLQKSITLAPMGCYFIEFAGGGNGKSLDFFMQPNSGVTVFEFGK